MTEPESRPPTMRREKPVYANLLSRLLVGPFFENQWVMPVRRAGLVERFFAWYERHRMDIRIDGIAVDRPIFIISLPRSGSSMLQDLICAHPDVAYITNMMYLFPESPCAAELWRRRLHLNIRGERFLQDSVDVDGSSPADPVATWARWFRQDPFGVSAATCTIKDFTLAELATIRDDIRRVLWCFRDDGRRRFECKTPALLPHVELLQDLFPDARFIYLVRDGRHNANSMLKLNRLCVEQLARIRSRLGARARLDARPFIPYPRLAHLPEYVAAYGVDDIRTTASLWRDACLYMEEVKPRIRHLYEVRYEDIVAQPARSMDTIFEFCELRVPGPAESAYAERLSQVGVLRHTNRYGSFDEIERICGDMLRHHRYL
jgi:hypothetical protein